MAKTKNKSTTIFVLILLLSFALRLFLSPIGSKTSDISVHREWSQNLYKQGTKDSYFRQGWILSQPTQPPLMMTLFNFSSHIYQNRYILSQLHNLIRLPPSSFILFFDKNGLEICLKIWAIFADVLSAIFIFLYFHKKNYKKAIFASSFFLFSPIILLETIIWGQNDILSTLFLTISFYLLTHKSKNLISPSLFLISIFLKPTALVLAPLYFFVYLKLNKFKTFIKIPYLFAINLAIISILFIPFINWTSVGDFFYQIGKIIQYRILPSSKGAYFASTSAFNLYSLLFKINITRGDQQLLFIPVKQFSTILAITINALLASSIFKQKLIKTKIWSYMFVASQLSFIFMGNMLERYFLVGFIASNIILFSTKDFKIKLSILILYLIHFLNMYYALAGASWPSIKIFFESNNHVLIRILSFINVFLSIYLSHSLLFKKTNKL